MTNFTTRMMIAAATLVVAAGAASAQTSLKAEIPFTFRVGNQTMSAGTYDITRLAGQSGAPIFRLRDEHASRAIMLLPQGAGDPKKAWAAADKPVLAFDCVLNRCALAQIWTGPSYPAYQIRHGDLGSEEPARVALVFMHAEKSE